MARPHVHVSIHICCNDFTANTKLHMMRQATIVFLKQYHSKRGAHVWVSLSMSQGLLGHVQGAGAPPPLIFFILKDFDIFRALQPVFGGRGGHM